jgi:hypothetical protein
MRAFGLALAALLLLAGCGGGDAEPSSEPAERTTPAATRTATPKPKPKPPTHAEFVRSLEKTCKSASAYRKSAQDFKAKVDARDFAGAAAAGREVQRTAARLQRRRRSLDVPRKDAREFRRYLDAEDDYLAVTRRLSSALRDRDIGGIITGVGALKGARDRRVDAASDLGVKKCGA